jgi:hypothetical protein
MNRRNLMRVLLGLTAAACLHGIAAHRLFAQPLWEPAGLRGFLAFAAGYASAAALLIWRAPRWFPAVLGSAALLYAALTAGPLAPAALLYCGMACYAVGSIWLPGKTVLAALLGLAVWICVVMLTAELSVHYRAVYWLLPLAPIGYALRRDGLWRPQWMSALPRRDLAALAIALFPLTCHWLIALKPEVSSDGLAMHAVIAARMAAVHAWPFDVSEFAWAVMPRGGDWAWSIAWPLGGEACARLLNVAVLGLMAWILMEQLNSRLPRWTNAGLAAAFLATPLTQHVTGSLFVENVVAALLLGAVVLLRLHGLEGGRRYYLACAFLCGLAAASKFGALAYVLPLLIAAAFLVRPRLLAAGLAITAVVGSVPYANAWLRTGNPFFPFFNAFFRSPLYPLENFRDARFETPLQWSTFYDLTFHSSRFIEGQDGSAGFLFFLLLPLCLAGWRWRASHTGTVALWVGLAGCVLTLLGQSNLRYLYPALPFFTLAAGIYIREARLLGAASTLALVLNLSMLPAAGWYHKGFYANQAFQPEVVAAYVERSAPERRLVEWLNVHAPGSRVAWLQGNAMGDFRGRAFTDSWHSDFFVRRLRAAESVEDLARLARELKLDYVIAPASSSPRVMSYVYTREFCDRFSDPVLSFGGVELRRLSASGKAPEWLPHAPPGRYDDITAFTRFTGAWTRDLQFRQAFQGTLVYSQDPRAAVSIRFRGTAVRLLYTAAANRCKGQVALDGAEARELNQYSAETRWQAESPLFRATGAGEHTLTLRAARMERRGCFVDLDGFVVE